MAARCKVVVLAVMTMVLAVMVAEPQKASAADTETQAESMTLSGTVFVHANGTPSGEDVAFYSGGTATKGFSGKPAAVTLRARQRACGSQAAQLKVYVDGIEKGTLDITTTSFSDYPMPITGVSDGSHTLKVEFVNDYSGSMCDRNAYLDFYAMTTGDLSSPPPGTVSNPLSGANIRYIAPDTEARITADRWYAEGRTADARQMEKVANNPRTWYFSHTSANHPYGLKGFVSDRVSRAHQQGAIPILGTYAIPHRDCGGYSAGGFTTPEGYRAWIDDFVAGIGDRKAVVILEPDALAGVSCLTSTQRAERYQLLSYAVHRLKANPKHHVYIDAGHSKWQTDDTMISRLEQANIAEADGFALNNANFQWTSTEITYGEKISAGVGGKHFIVDTSRNGLGPWITDQPDPWCNPPGRALGTKPTTNTGHPLVDAFLWLKDPGVSDGACRGSTRAGEWKPEYALGLAQRAAW